MRKVHVHVMERGEELEGGMSREGGEEGEGARKGQEGPGESGRRGGRGRCSYSPSEVASPAGCLRLD